ncbi:MAG: type III secretion system domain-containing protein [Plesiomonas sp.]
MQNTPKMNNYHTCQYHLHQLAWMPAKFAHPVWLQRAGVLAEDYCYGKYLVLDQALNMYLIQQHFPDAYHTMCDITGKQYWFDKNTSFRVATALGLFALRCQEYLLLRTYRDALQPILSEPDIHQLIGLGCGGKQAPSLPPNRLVECAKNLGFSLLQAHYQSNFAWKAASIQFPPIRTWYCAQAPRWITTLERFFDFTQTNETNG